MIGDRAVDIEAEHSNGMRAVGVLYGYGLTEEIEQASPEWIIDTPTNLFNTLSPFTRDKSQS